MSPVVRSAAASIPEAAAENRGVIRTFCMALEQVARAGVRAARDLGDQTVAAWRPVPRAGSVMGRIIAGVTRGVVAVLSMAIGVLIAADVLLNTAAEWRLLHPRVR